MDWQPIDTAPQYRSILLFGRQCDGDAPVRHTSPVVFSGYWDDVDGAWCAHGSSWEGPFFKVTHWMPLPDPPKSE